MLKYGVSFFALVVSVFSGIAAGRATEYVWTQDNFTNQHLQINYGDTLSVNGVVANGIAGSPYNGGLITNAGTIKEILNSTFSNYSVADSYNGGVIYSTSKDGGQLNQFIKIKNSKFINNSADKSGGAIGGAVSGEMHIEDSLFQGNYTRNTDIVGGGAINIGRDHLASDKPFVLYIKNSQFIDNHSSAEGRGDAVRRAVWGGGAIRLDSGKVRFSGVNEFRGNWTGQGDAAGGRNRNDIELAAASATDNVPWLYVDDGTLILDGGIRGVRNGDLDGARLNARVTVENGATLEARNEGEYTLIRGVHFVNNGTVKVDTGRSLLFFHNGAASKIVDGNVEQDSYGRIINNNNIENNGTVKIGDSILEMTDNAKVTGKGTMILMAIGDAETENGQTLAKGEEIEAELYISGANAQIENALVNKGKISILADKDLTIGGALTNNKNIVNEGVLNIAGGGTNSGTVANAGTVNVKGGTLTLNKGISGIGTTKIAAGAGVSVAGDKVDIENSVENKGVLTVFAGKSLNLLNGGTNDGTLDNAGTVAVNGGILTLNKDISGKGKLVLGKAAGLKLNQANTTIANSVESAAEIDIAKGKTLTVQNDFVNNGTFKNNGVFIAEKLANGKLLYNNAVMKTKSMELAAGSKMYLGVSSVTETGNYAADNTELVLDMLVNGKDKKIQNGLLKISGNVSGTTNVIVNALSTDVFSGASTLYVDAPNDTTGVDGSFTVARVYGSPYMWNSKRVAGETGGNQWYLNIAEDKPNDDFEGEIPDLDSDPDNPDPDNPDNPDPDNPDKPDKPGSSEGDKPHKPTNPVYAPEVNAYSGLAEAVVEQSRGIIDDVRSGLAFEKSILCYQESCGLAETVPHKRAWAHISNRGAQLDVPSEMDAKIWGFTAGADFYRDYDRRAGVFGFYRNGSYDLSGRGKYLARLGADIKNESFAGGLYYQFDNGDNKFLSTLYAGRQNIDFKADDGFARANTDANQIGVSVESGKRYYLSDEVTLEPGVGASYMVADIDGFTDSVGKSVSYNTLHYWEVEAGVKAEYTFCDDGLTRRVYIRPSVVQTFAKGDKVKISGIDGRANTYKDQTLGRIRTGGQFGLTQRLSGFADVGYTFGREYEAYDVQFGLNYSF